MTRTNDVRLMSPKRVLEKTIAVGLVLPDLPRGMAEEHLAELEKLIETAGGVVVERELARRTAPDPATFVGKGKAEQLKTLVDATGATLIVFDDDLSPAQARNLEKVTGVAVIDRSGLILDIFAGRARSREARTQVELAQLEYTLPRLTRAWSHLERQAGGIGTRGVGETQLELDRRIIRNRIAHLKTELRKIERTRATQRKGRGETFVVALVGYTNAGKSTLFNRLTQGSTLAMDKLFATLDAKTQRIAFPTPRDTVVVDTVGFIRKLPHDLVASFRSTMEESASADLVLHVIDASHPQFEEQRAVGEQVLKDLGVDDARVFEVLNKADRVAGCQLPVAGDQRATGNGQRATISALTGDGIENLVDAIRSRELKNGDIISFEIPHNDSRMIARLHEVAEVYEQRATDHAMMITAWVPFDALHLFDAYATNVRRAKVS